MISIKNWESKIKDFFIKKEALPLFVFVISLFSHDSKASLEFTGFCDPALS